MASRREPPDPTRAAATDALLDRAERSFRAGRFERALGLAEQALAQAPGRAEAVWYRAAALARLDRGEEAAQAVRDALRAAPDDPDLLYNAADFLLVELTGDQGMAEDALALAGRAIALARTAGDEDRLVDLLLLQATALGDLGQPLAALVPLDEAAKLSPDDPDVACERGAGLLEALRFDEARTALERAVSLDRRLARAHHLLGLLDERAGDLAAAERRFREARKLDPGQFPKPVELKAESFEQAVEDALVRLPAKVRDYLSNVAVLVEEIPDISDLEENHPPLSPGIVGLFRGTPYTEQSTGDPWSWFPTAIVLFQKNLQRSVRSLDELVEQIEITLLHEVGHFLGLSEEELWARGLD